MALQTLDQLRKLQEELPGVMEEVMQLFIADAPRQMREIEQAYEQADADALRQTSHYLRSGALALRLEWVADLVHRLEFLAPTDFGEPATTKLVASLRTEVNSVVVALLDELSKSGGGSAGDGIS
jgi:HPt (histidine-containing phosphotransfer) domain-containing protein